MIGQFNLSFTASPNLRPILCLVSVDNIASFFLRLQITPPSEDCLQPLAGTKHLPKHVKAPPALANGTTILPVYPTKTGWFLPSPEFRIFIFHFSGG